MGKIYTALGLMSGTSGDGIDQFNEVTNKYFKYDQKIYENLHYLRGKILKSNDLNINEGKIDEDSLLPSDSIIDTSTPSNEVPLIRPIAVYIFPILIFFY